MGIFVYGVTALQYHGCSFDGEYWPAEASSVYAWSPRTLRFNTSAAPTQTYMPGSLHNTSPIIFSALTLCPRNKDIQFCAFFGMTFVFVISFMCSFGDSLALFTRGGRGGKEGQ